MSDSLALLQTNQAVHWAFAYLGTPWVRGGEGPGYDCYSFVRMVQHQHFGIVMPVIDVDADDFRAVATHMQQSHEKANWQRVSQPQEGDCVLMAHAKYPTHIGVYLAADGGGVLHCVRGEGVVFSSLSALVLSGWGRLEYYRYASCA
ncbi:NlpC/P60 family protein [Methylophilus sp. VKM B-3414]|uniref:C40 family peptidase n=1 Tax=Methylophilus sp. VKM B-3414 TaxID=3076121 RepID=UPI0028C6CACB|nr:NlpC/P60 family protein [Methylophilus sp. VKM B-3414]MDT7849912.1 NlpC/P60 family protein [Methylophilus sp. VKM B-3414]